MKIRITFKEVFLSDGKVVTNAEVEADSWLIEGGLVSFKRTEKGRLTEIAVYDMGCVLGFEVVSS